MAIYGSLVPSDVQGGFSFKNKIINGDFNVWQRGTSFSSSSVNEYSADRFRTEGYGHNSVISRQTFTVGQTAVPGYPTYFCRVASSSTVSSGQFWGFTQRIECPQVMSGSGTYTLSYWVKSTTAVDAGSFYYGIDGYNQAGPALSTTWQKITYTTTLSNNESNGYVTVYLASFIPGQGNKTIDIANVQLEYGSQATPFERRPFPTELALCQRYYQKSYNYTKDPGSTTGHNELEAPQFAWGSSAAGIAGGTLAFPVVMRATPTLTIYDHAGNSGKFTGLSAGASQTNNVAPNVSFASTTKVMVRTYSNSYNGMEWNYTVSAEL